MPSIYPVDPTDVETFTIVANPRRTFVSSSTQGVTGSVYLFARRSPIVKDAAPDSSFVESAHDDGDYASTLRSAQQAGRMVRAGAFSGSFFGMMDQYMRAVNAEGQQLRLQQKFDVVRFSPPPVFNSNTLRKLFVKDVLNAYYRTSYPTAHWAYTNYNSLNFFTASGFPTSSALLYPNVDGGTGGMVFHEGYCSGTYTPSGSFSFDFYINPRYTTDQRDGSFRAGTILHLSSTYALSLVSGSSKDVNGRPVGFRLQLQLSHSADTAPSLALPGSFPHDLTFLSDDNSLWHNNWHHVVVRWGTQDINGGTGTFNIDGVDRGTFLVPSSTITPRLYAGIQAPPTVLCLGNFFEGSNHGNYEQANFFAADPATRDGLQQLIAQTGIDEPQGYSFNHPLNAELHDVAIRRCYLSDFDVRASSSVGPSFLDNTFAFYVPPFFVEQSPYRQFVGTHGGILVTPFEEVDGATTRPFSTALSFGVAGHYINLENFAKDLASEVFPRLHHLTGAAITVTTDAETCNQFLYSQPFVAKRNLTVMPCDDGLFVPNFQLLASESLQRAVDDLGIDELSFVQLDDMVLTSTLMFGGPDTDSLADQQLGSAPESPFAQVGPATTNYIQTVSSGSDVEAGAPLTVFQRTRDPSSNEVVVFDVSNLFYGLSISPQSLRLCDPDMVRSSYLGANLALTTSSGAQVCGPVKVTLADDGRGNLYRADCLTTQSSWNSVGNVYYDEGLVVVKSPHLYFFGQDAYRLDLRGVQHVHSMKVDVLAPNNQLNSSSNPSYRAVPPTGYPNDTDDSFVYVSGINFHDTDLNVVMKAQLAQPILKRYGDRIMFKVRYDF